MDGESKPKLTVNECLTYLRKVEDAFGDKKDEYNKFLEILKDFKAQRIDIQRVVARVNNLLEGHQDLILGFNCLLPNGYEITVPNEQDDLLRVLLADLEAADYLVNCTQQLMIQDAVAYLTAVKGTFRDNREKYDEFIEIMLDYKAHRVDVTGMVTRVKELFGGHRNLVLGFNTFLKKEYAIVVPPEED